MKKISLIAIVLFASVSLMAQDATKIKKDKAGKTVKAKEVKFEAPAAVVVPAEELKTVASTVATPAPVAKDITKYLAFSETAHAFNKIPQGKPVEFDVTVKNISHDSIKIERVDVQCGCTTPKYTAGAKYGPGESFKVTLGFNAAAMGHFTKNATFVFSDGLQQVINFNGETYQVATDAAPANEATEKLKPANK